MGVIINQSIKGTVYTYIGVLLGFVTTGLLLPRIFSTDEVGLLKIIVAYSAIFAQFGTLGLNGVIIRQFPIFHSEKNKHHGFLLLALLVGTAGLFISSGTLMLLKPWILSEGAEKSALFVEYFNTLLVLIFFQLYFYILDSYYSALLNSVTGTFLKEVIQRIAIIMAIVLFYYDQLTFSQFVWVYVAAISLPTLNILFSVIRNGHFSLKSDWGFYNKSLVISMASVSLFSIVTGFSSVIVQSVDLIMINSMLGLKEVGIYSVCFFFGVMINLPNRSITKIGNIVAARAWKDNDMETLKQLYYKSCLTLFILGMLLFLGLWVNIDNVFKLLGPDYVAGKWVIFFIALGCLVDMTTGVNSALLGTSKYYKVQTAFLLTLVVLIVISNLMLIPRFGMNGAAAGNAISLTILNLLRYFFLKVKFNLQPFNTKFLYVVLIGAIAYILSFMIPTLDNYIFDILVRGTALLLLFGIPVIAFKVSEDINKKYNELKQMLLSKI